jgi:hypothetical protein
MNDESHGSDRTRRTDGSWEPPGSSGEERSDGAAGSHPELPFPWSFPGFAQPEHHQPSLSPRDSDGVTGDAIRPDAVSNLQAARLGRPSDEWDVEFEVPVVRNSVLWLQILLIFLTAAVVVPTAIIIAAHEPAAFDYLPLLVVLIPLSALLATLSWRSFSWGRGSIQIQSNGIARRLVDTTGRDHLTVRLPAAFSCGWQDADFSAGENPFTLPNVELFITLRDSDGYVILTITADSQRPPDGWAKGRKPSPSNAVGVTGPRDSTAQTMEQLATLVRSPLV